MVSCLAEEGKPCYSGALCNIWFILPLGSIVGLAISYFAYFTYLGPYFSDVEKAVKAMGIDISQLTGLVGSGSIFVLAGNLLVVLYGFREKTRTRLNVCAHRYDGISTTVKFVFKSVLHLVVLASVAIMLALFVLFESLWIMLLVVNALCDAGGTAVDAVDEVLEIFGGGSSNSAKICANAGEGTTGAWWCFIGALILLGSQGIVFAYWMKYSTLANVAAYWTTGDYAEDNDVENDLQDEKY